MIPIVTCYNESKPGWGKTYGERHVEALAKNVHDIFGQELEVIEDDRWPSWWCKMAMYEKPRDFLYVDLSSIFVGIPTIPDRATVLRDFYRRGTIATGCMRVTPEMCFAVWGKWWGTGPGKVMQTFRGDQEFLDSFLTADDVDFWQDVAPGEICSYKVHCQDLPPESARVICYHGHPKIEKTGWATGGASMYRIIPEGAYPPP